MATAKRAGQKPGGRSLRVADQIQRDLAELIPREVRDPRVGLVTLSGVEVTPDYAHAKVFFTVIGSPPAQSAAGLNAAAGHLHHLLFKRLRIHTVPRLAFVHDESVARGFELDRLIHQAVADLPPANDEAAAGGHGAPVARGAGAAAEGGATSAEPAVPDDAVPDDALRDPDARNRR